MSDEDSEKQAQKIKLRKRRIWLVSFGDMSALVLTFFILLFSVSSFDQNFFKKLADSVKEVASDIVFDPRVETPFIPQDKNVDTRDPRIGLSLDYLYNVLQTNFSEDAQLNKVIFTRLDNRLVLSLPAELIFRKGSASLNQEGVRYIRRLAASLQSADNAIQVSGHTDPDPVTGFFPSNWELSLSRAVNIVGVLESSGVEGKISASGHADSYYRLLGTDEDTIDYVARRVDIEILDEIGEDL